MSQIRARLSALLAALPAILLVTFINCFIVFTTAGVVLLQLLAAGCPKYLALGASLLTAVLVHAWIVFNHKLRDYIKNLEKKQELPEDE